jgi:transcriptional regulator with XRE-family HTH domain
MSYKDRLEKIRKHYNIKSFRLFAEETKLNPMTVNHIVNGRNQPKEGTVVKILKRFPEINGEWLRTGEGDMFFTNKKTGVGKRIKEYREKHFLSEESFSEALGISSNYLKGIESEDVEIPLAIFKEVIKKFGINFNWLLFGKIEESDSVKIAEEIAKHLPQKGFDLSPIINSKLDIIMQEIQSLKKVAH